MVSGVGTVCEGDAGLLAEWAEVWTEAIHVRQGLSVVTLPLGHIVSFQTAS